MTTVLSIVGQKQRSGGVNQCEPFSVSHWSDDGITHTHTAPDKHVHNSGENTILPDQEECVNPKIERAAPRTKVQWVFRHSGFPLEHVICNKRENRVFLFPSRKSCDLGFQNKQEEPPSTFIASRGCRAAPQLGRRR